MGNTERGTTAQQILELVERKPGKYGQAQNLLRCLEYPGSGFHKL